MIDPNFSSPTLSSQGEARRDAILALALRAARRRRWQQPLRRGGVAAAVLCLTLITAVTVVFRPGRVDVAGPHAPSPAGGHAVPEPPPRKPPVASRRPGLSSHTVTIGHVRTERGIADRLAVRSPTPGASAAPPPLPRVSDEELLASLAKAGRPAGLAYVDDKAVLLFRERTKRQ